MSRRRRRLVEIVLGTIASVALVLSILTAAGAVTLPGLNGGDNDLLALGQGAGQTPDKVATVRRAEPPLVATPLAKCGPGSRPEPGVDGRVPAGSGVNGLWCNMTEIAHQGTSGGFKVFRYVDQQGHVCAFYDTALLFPTNAVNAAGPSLGVAVLDMTDPAHPVQTDTLTELPMMTPHESLNLNTTRGLLAAVNGNPATEPGLVSIYDVHADCRHPVLDSTSLVARFGHESGFSPDGKTFYATSTALPSITAIDVTDPKHPQAIWQGNILAHGMTLSDDGNRAYIADPNGGDMLILDTSQIQARDPNPQAKEISRLTWGSASIPQNAIPFTENGHPYVLEFDEYTQATLNPTGDPNAVGAARIIDISDETKPFVVANLRLQVDQPPTTGRQRRPRHAQPRAGVRGALLQHPDAASIPRSSPARSSPPGCACSTSAICCTPRRSATSWRPPRPTPRPATARATTRCRSRRSTSRAMRSGTPTAAPGSTSSASTTGCGHPGRRRQLGPVARRPPAGLRARHSGPSGSG